MQINSLEAGFDLVWLDGAQDFSVEDIAAHTGASLLEIQELIEHDVLVPISHSDLPWHFNADCIFIVNQARRLREDMHLTAHELAITLTLLERIRRLEAALALAIAQQPIFRRY